MPSVVHAPATVAVLERLSRREFVNAAGASLVACLVAGCGGDDDADAPTAPGATTLPPGVRVTGTEVTVDLAVHAALRSAGSLLVANGGADGVRLLVVGFGGGRFGAFTSVCPHVGTINRWARTSAGALTCQNHGSVFDAVSGAVLAGPAEFPLQAFAVTVEPSALRIRVG
jgi:nitrite reductase/ring-hydroxylating ferredoxin subunit